MSFQDPDKILLCNWSIGHYTCSLDKRFHLGSPTMRTIALILVALIACLHTYIAWFEIFAWETRGPKVFSSFPTDLFAKTVAMAANQGIYNAFLAAGLFWAFCIKDRLWQRNVATCFLLFVFIAGVFGAATVTSRTFFIQSVPAAIVLLLLYLGSTKPHSANQTN